MKLVSITVFIEEPNNLRQAPVFSHNGTHCPYDIWDLIWDVLSCLHLCFFYQLNVIIFAFFCKTL